MVFTNMFKAVIICNIRLNSHSSEGLKIDQKQHFSLGGKIFLFNLRRALSHGAIQLAVLPPRVAFFASTIY